MPNRSRGPGRGVSRTDVATIAYLLVTGALIVAFRENVPGWGWHLALRGAILAGLAVLVYAAGRTRSTVVDVVHVWYPLGLFLVLYHEVGSIVHVVNPGFVDGQIIVWEGRLFG